MEWAKLPAHQQDAINNFLAKHTSELERDATLANIFSSWDSTQQPTVPSVSHLRFDEFAFSFIGQKLIRYHPERVAMEIDPGHAAANANANDVSIYH